MRLRDDRGRLGAHRGLPVGSSTSSARSSSSPGYGWPSHTASRRRIQARTPSLRFARTTFPSPTPMTASEFLRMSTRSAWQPPAARPDLGRDHGPDLRRRLHSGDLRDHDRPVHRLHVERVRDPRPAGPLLPPRRPQGPVPLPEARPRGHPRLCRREADRGEPGDQDRPNPLARRRGVDPRRGDRRVVAAPEMPEVEGHPGMPWPTDELGRPRS